MAAARRRDGHQRGTTGHSVVNISARLGTAVRRQLASSVRPTDLMNRDLTAGRGPARCGWSISPKCRPLGDSVHRRGQGQGRRGRGRCCAAGLPRRPDGWAAGLGGRAPRRTSGMALWWRDYADPHVQILTDPAGPFFDCGNPEQEDRLARLVGTEFAPTVDVDGCHGVRSSQPRDPSPRGEGA